MAEPSKRRTRARAKHASQHDPQPPFNPDDPPHPMSNHPDFQRHPEAAQYEQAVGFDMPWKFMFENVMRIKDRKFEHTRWIDLSAFEKFGMLDEFLELTTRIGITPAFWNHRELAYERYTIEFLCSLKLLEENGRDIIVFRLANKSHKADIQDIGEFFGLERDCPLETSPYNQEFTSEMVWDYLSGEYGSRKSRLVHHPTLRLLLRAYASQIFTRGETANVTNDKELGLMWHTLQPNPVKVNVIKYMIEHWIYQRDKISKGAITLGGYVTLIALHLNYPRLRNTKCGGFSLYDDERYKSAQFIQIYKQPGGVVRYKWVRKQGTDFFLPYPHRVNLENPATWVIPNDYVQPPVALPGPVQVPAIGPVPMHTGQEGPSHQPQQAATGHDFSQAPPWALALRDMMGNLTNLTMETRDEVRLNRTHTQENGAHLNRLSHEVQQYGQRLDRIERAVYADDPNLGAQAPSHDHASPASSHHTSHHSPMHSSHHSPVHSHMSPVPSHHSPSIHSHASPVLSHHSPVASHEPLVQPQDPMPQTDVQFQVPLGYGPPPHFVIALESPFPYRLNDPRPPLMGFLPTQTSAPADFMQQDQQDRAPEDSVGFFPQSSF